MQTFIWHPTESFLHGLNPLTKLALALLVAVEVSTTVEPVSPLAIALLAFCAAKVLGRLPWGVFVRPWTLVGVLSIGMFWTSTLFYAGAGTGSVVLEAGPLRITTAALVYGLTIAARLLAIFSASLLYVLTTDPTELVLALIQQAKLPYRIGYAVFVAYRFLPLVQEEFGNIQAAHRVRGIRDDGGVVGRIRTIWGYLIPLLAISVRKAERVALAMDSRAFGALPERTYYRTTSIGRRDTLFAACSLTVLAAPIVIRAFLLPAITI